MPAPIAAIAFQNKATVYTILFSAAAEAMTTLAANPRRLLDVIFKKDQSRLRRGNRATNMVLIRRLAFSI